MVGPRAGWLAAPGRHDRQSSPLGIPDVPDPAADRPQPGSLDRPRGACAGGLDPDGRGRRGRGRAGRPLGRGERRAASLSRRAAGDMAGPRPVRLRRPAIRGDRSHPARTGRFRRRRHRRCPDRRPAQLGPWRASRRGVAPQSSARAATAACSGRRGSGHRNAGTSGMPGNIIPWRASRCPPATSMAMARRTWSSGGIDTAAGRAGVPQPSRWTSSRAARVAISARPAPCTWDSTRGASRMSFGSRPTSSSRRPGRTSWCDTSTRSPGL